MSFLAPLFLVGLAALAVPVLLHLIQRERKNVVQFPSLMFLRRIPYQSVQRRRIRALAAAGAAAGGAGAARDGVRAAVLPPRPTRRRPRGSGAREVVVLLDRSYSMGYGDRWQKRGGRGAGDDRRPAAGGPRHARAVRVERRSGAALDADRSRLLAVVAGVQPGAGATRYGPALKLAGSVLGESRAAAPRSDPDHRLPAQRLAGRAKACGCRMARRCRARSGRRRRDREPVGDAGVAAALDLREPAADRRHRRRRQPRRRRAVKGVELTLEVGGRGVQTQRVDVEPGGSASATFAPVTVAERNVRAAVRLPQGRARARQRLQLRRLARASRCRVIVAERPGAPRDGSLYLTRALAIGEAPRVRGHRARRRRALGRRSREGARSWCSTTCRSPTSLGERLTRFVEGGGGLLVVAGEQVGLGGARRRVLPGVPGQRRSIAAPAARRGSARSSTAIPCFELFRAPRSGDFSAARFYGYRAVEAAAGAQVLARFDDGAPALVERRSRRRPRPDVDLVARPYWNDLAAQAGVPAVRCIA